MDQYAALSLALETFRPVEIWFSVVASDFCVAARLATALMADMFVRILDIDTLSLTWINFVSGTFRIETGTTERPDAYGKLRTAPNPQPVIRYGWPQMVSHR